MIPKVKQKALASSQETSLLKRQGRNPERKLHLQASLRSKARKAMLKARAKSLDRWRAMNPDNPRVVNSPDKLLGRGKRPVNSKRMHLQVSKVKVAKRVNKVRSLEKARNRVSRKIHSPESLLRWRRARARKVPEAKKARVGSLVKPAREAKVVSPLPRVQPNRSKRAHSSSSQPIVRNSSPVVVNATRLEAAVVVAMKAEPSSSTKARKSPMTDP
jgi:hypothetical protein